jgi:farnesyl diphosphate synthase
MLDKSLLEAMNFSTKLVENKMKELLPTNFHESSLANAIQYSVMSGGKRIRPFLTMISAQIFGVDPFDSVNTAAAIEFIHTYSLIHDDLPAMDNDDFRRGKLTCHKKFDEATAILAGDALLTYAFEILSDQKTHKDPFVRCELIKIIASSAGFKGMVGGQMIDLEMANQEISKEQIAKLHRLKTGELFMASCSAGAILGYATEDEKNALRYYAHDLGLAFQIKDDILDHYGVETGKINLDENIHKKSKDNASIVDIVGIDNALKQLNMLKEQAISHLKIFGDKSKILVALSEFIVSRER